MQTQPVAKSVNGSRAGIEVRSNAPFAVGVVLWRDESRRVVATVVAKATYSLAQGTSDILEEPDPIRPRDEYWEDGAAASLRFPSDLALFKPAHEVLVVGHVYATGNRPTHAATARVAVVEVEKQIVATTPRRFERGGQLHTSPPNTRFSLRYEFAPGGAATNNPVGIDATALTPTGGYVLPQLTPPNIDVRPGDHVPLVGMGPVSHSWPARDALLRPQDREWLLDPLRRARPQGFDARYFCAAPEDQRSTESFRPGERIILEGLHPAHARLVTNLAAITPALRSVGARRKAPPFVADTLYIDTDRQIVTLAFRAIIPLDDDKLVFDLVGEGDLDETSVLNVRGDEATTELQKSAFGDVASMDLPFAPSSEPGRARTQASAEGLPFRKASDSTPPVAPPSTPPALPPPASALPPASSPQSVPRPSLVSLPPVEAFAEPEPTAPPPAPRSTIGEVQSLLRAARKAERGPDAPPSSQGLEPGAPRTEDNDPFRKAFGSGGSADRQPPATTSNPSASVSGTKVSSRVSSRVQALNGAASLGGAKAASDAAAASQSRDAMDTREASEMRDAVGSAAPPVDRPRATRRAIVDLLACDPGVPKRLRRSKTYAPVLSGFAAAPGPQKLDDPAAEQDQNERERIDVLRVLSCGTPLDPGQLHAALDSLLDDELELEIPLMLVEGEVKPTMDQVEALRVAASLAKPLGANNKRVQAALAAANDALSASATLTSEAATVLYKQLEAATHELSLPSRYLADQVDRVLLEARSFKKRTLLGAPRIRADLSIGKTTLPIYLPESVASQLPLLPTVSVMALVELRPREDVSEPNPDALIVLAMGRVLRARK